VTAGRPRRAVVCADLEGIGGVDTFEGCFPAWPRAYREARALMEGEVAAAVSGLRDAGVDDVVVCDWHFAGTNLRRDRVDAPVVGLWQQGRPTMSRRDGYGDRDLAVFVGMHGAAGASSFMAHTFWQGLACTVDGVAVNEAYLWSTMVGAGGARTGLVVGDDRVVDECAVLLPGVPVLPVKSSRSRDRARTSQRPEALREQIRQAAADAARDHRDRPRVVGPVGAEVRVTFQEAGWADRFARQGHGDLDGPRTVATRLEHPDGLVPLLSRATLAMPAGRETALYSRVVPPPEQARVPEPVRAAVAGCLHTLARPLMRHGVRVTQRMPQDRYPTPPGEPGAATGRPPSPGHGRRGPGH
jgi:D-amino peptidase